MPRYAPNKMPAEVKRRSSKAASPRRSREIHQIAGGRNDILARAAGTTVGSWWAAPKTQVGHELVVAGMLILAGDRLNYDESARWAQVRYERASAQRYGPIDPDLARRGGRGQSDTGESCPRPPPVKNYCTWLEVMDRGICPNWTSTNRTNGHAATFRRKSNI